MKKDIAIQVGNVNKTFYVNERSKSTIRSIFATMLSPNKKREIKALRDINFEVHKGEFFGVLGHNGSGKSTLLKLLNGSLIPDKGGELIVKGKVIRLALGMGFDPKLTARYNVYLNASLLGLPISKIDEIFNEIIKFAELEDFVDTQVKFFSSGMRSRLAFAVAVHAEADIFLLDEFFGGVGDINFKNKSAETFSKKVIEGRTIIHVSHNLQNLANHCDRILLLHRGHQIAVGEPQVIIEKYKQLMKKR